MNAHSVFLRGLSVALDGQVLREDGSVIVGEALVPGQPIGTMVINESHAVRWTGANVQTVAAWLAANGVTNGTNQYQNALGVSDDGNVVVGYGIINGHKQGYIARVAGAAPTPTPTPSCPS